MLKYLEEHKSAIQMIIAAGALITAIAAPIGLWLTFTNYVDGVATKLQADYVERDQSVLQNTGTAIGVRTKMLKAIIEESNLGGYKAIQEILEQRAELLSKRLADMQDLPHTNYKKGLVLDELKRVDDILEDVERLIKKVDKIWDPNLE